MISKGKISDPDKFPVGWHPHRGKSMRAIRIK